MQKKLHTINDKLWNSLRDCQKHAIEVALSYLNQQDVKTSCLLSLPTGSGKSGVISTLAHVTKKKNILILCHRRAVKDQLKKQIRGEFFSKVAPGENFMLRETFEFNGQINQPGIYLSTFQKLSLLSSDELEKLAEVIDLLIIDEGHSEPSPYWSQLARGLSTHKLIITATPYRNDLFQFDINPDHSLIYTFKQAIEEDILVNPEFSEIEQEDLIEVIKVKLDSQPGSKCIVKCKNIDEIEHYYEILSAHFTTLAIHDKYCGNVTQNQKSAVPQKLHSSDWEVLIHQKKLDEGVDIPNAKILILTYQVASGRELTQCIGRIVRKHEDFEAHVVEFLNSSNHKMWTNYLSFDSYLTDKHASMKFLKTLHTSALIDSYLEAFPEISYFGSNYRKKFNLKEFVPEHSLSIPLASVCFITKQTKFTIETMIDSLIWQAQKTGELVEHREVEGSHLLISISFNNSKFLSDELFFEPKLEIFIVRDAGDTIAIFDSRGRKFTSNSELGLGQALDVEKLLNLSSRSNYTRTREAHSKSIGSSIRRPESVSMTSSNLESITNLSQNGAYALSRLKVDNVDATNSKHSSYYLGVSSGRVSDQKNRNFSITELNTWIDDISHLVGDDYDLRSEFIKSFAKPVDELPVIEPLSLIVDFSDYPCPIHFDFSGNEYEVENDLIFFNYEDGFKLINGIDLTIKVATNPKTSKIEFSSDDDPEIHLAEDVPLNIDPTNNTILKVLNSSSVKVLYEDGITYTDGYFYRITLPNAEGVDLSDTKIGASIIGIDTLQKDDLSEKDEQHTEQNEFGSNSVFRIIDTLKLVSADNPSIADLGPFYHYIPDIDLLMCTDMGTEPADFILSSPSKLIFVHVKCGNAQNPRSSAGALAEAGGQAIKNIEYLISHDQELEFANVPILKSKWPNVNAAITLDERIRLFDKQRFVSPAGDQAALENNFQNVVDLIKKRRRSPAVEKEIWLVVGNAFSKNHFFDQMQKGNEAQGESRQAYQLIQSWLASASAHDAAFKLFCSP